MDKTDTKDDYEWEQETDMSSLIHGPEEVIKYVRFQEHVIRELKKKSEKREQVIRDQDVAANLMYSENVKLAQKLDYYRLATVIMLPSLMFFVGVYFW